MLADDAKRSDDSSTAAATPAYDDAANANAEDADAAAAAATTTAAATAIPAGSVSATRPALQPARNGRSA